MDEPDFFERLDWQPDRMLLGDLVFRLRRCMSPMSEGWGGGGGDHFVFAKGKELVDRYRGFFHQHAAFRPERVVELGIFDGGSVAFWFELFRPRKHVALDLKNRDDSDYFRHYVESRGLSDRIKTFWRSNQADKDRLRSLVASEFDGPLDLVIDDASHLYGPTRASFEVLFSMLAPGGLYLIEDWAWAHWPEFIAANEGYTRKEPPTKLVFELIEAAGTNHKLISQITVYRDFVAVERGPLPLDPASFSLDDHIYRMPSRRRRTGPARLFDRIKAKLS